MICHRCGKETLSHITSMFNMDDLCMNCKAEEEQHPDYEEAKRIELAAVKRGDFNFPGVGWPGKEGRIKR